MTKTPTNTAYCENCMCYVPEVVACSDPECPVEDHVYTGDSEEMSPIDFKDIGELHEVAPEDWAEKDEDESFLREMMHGRTDDQDPYCGC